MQRTRIKICGIRTPEAADVATESGADAIGVVFAKSSPRFIAPAEAARIIERLPAFVTPVGLTVNDPVSAIEEFRAASDVQVIQLHGQESPELAAAVGAPVVKAIEFDPRTALAELARWRQVVGVRALLIDGSCGGRGESFDWSAFGELQRSSELPLVLAGGLTPDNVAEAIELARPFAVDVSSGVESSSGTKSSDLIRAFCRAVREADSARD